MIGAAVPWEKLPMEKKGKATERWWATYVVASWCMLKLSNSSFGPVQLKLVISQSSDNERVIIEQRRPILRYLCWHQDWQWWESDHFPILPCGQIRYWWCKDSLISNTDREKVGRNSGSLVLTFTNNFYDYEIILKYISGETLHFLQLKFEGGGYLRRCGVPGNAAFQVVSELAPRLKRKQYNR